MLEPIYVPHEHEGIKESIFLMGPTPRAETGGESWRPAMLEHLAVAGFDGVVYIPEDEGKEWLTNYDDQINWELKHLHKCDAIVAWVPRDLVTLPGFTTNVEFGIFVRHMKMLYGRPEGAPKTRYLDNLYHRYTGRKPATSMEELARACVEFVVPR